jgi:RimJ/RimL family protein N-acetyltransferase
MTFTIREPLLSDAEAMCAYIARLADEPDSNLSFSLGEGRFTLEQEQGFIQAHIGKDNAAIFIAVAHDGEIIGSCSAAGGDGLAAQHHTVTLGISVHADWRGRGVGTALMQRMVMWARENPTVHRLQLDVFARNEGATRLYERCGFQHEGVRRGAYYKDGRFIDALMMAIIFERDFYIRQAHEFDAGRAAAYMARLADEPDNMVSLSPGEGRMTVDEERALIREYRDADNAVMLVVVTPQGEIVAIATVQGGKISAKRHTAVLGISVDNAWRGRGVGRALMQRVVEWARQNPIIHRLELEVFTHNTRAIRLYQQFGFELEATLREDLYKDGQYRDSHMMALLFDRSE